MDMYSKVVKLFVLITIRRTCDLVVGMYLCRTEKTSWEDGIYRCLINNGSPVALAELESTGRDWISTNDDIWVADYFEPSQTGFNKTCGTIYIFRNGSTSEELYSDCLVLRYYICNKGGGLQVLNNTWEHSKSCGTFSKADILKVNFTPGYFWTDKTLPGNQGVVKNQTTKPTTLPTFGGAYHNEIGGYFDISVRLKAALCLFDSPGTLSGYVNCTAVGSTGGSETRKTSDGKVAGITVGVVVILVVTGAVVAVVTQKRYGCIRYFHTENEVKDNPVRYVNSNYNKTSGTRTAKHVNLTYEADDVLHIKSTMKEPSDKLEKKPNYQDVVNKRDQAEYRKEQRDIEKHQTDVVGESDYNTTFPVKNDLINRANEYSTLRSLDDSKNIYNTTIQKAARENDNGMLSNDYGIAKLKSPEGDEYDVLSGAKVLENPSSNIYNKFI